MARAKTFHEKYSADVFRYAFGTLIAPLLRSYKLAISDEEFIQATVRPEDREILTKAADIADDFSPQHLVVSVNKGFSAGREVRFPYCLQSGGPVQFILPRRVVWDKTHPATEKLNDFVRQRTEMGMRLASARSAILNLVRMVENGQQLRATLPSIDTLLERHPHLKPLLDKPGSAKHNIVVSPELGRELKDAHGLLTMLSMVDADRPEPEGVSFDWLVREPGLYL